MDLPPLPKALIVDDEAPARSELRYLLNEAGGVEVVGEASTSAEALQLIAAIDYDIVFLDIEMPGLTGLDLAAALAAAESSPAIVFVTAYGEHALKAFEVAATDYLVKPVGVDRLRQALARIAAGPAAPPGPESGSTAVASPLQDDAGAVSLCDAHGIDRRTHAHRPHPRREGRPHPVDRRR